MIFRSSLLCLLFASFVLVAEVCYSFQTAIALSPPSKSLYAQHLLFQSSSALFYDDDDEGTVSSWTTSTGQTITLIGTAHLSEKSNAQVERIISACQPNCVLVELDPTRLSRIGIESIGDIQNLQVVTSEDILLPNESQRPWYWLLLNGFAQVARKLLTGMYDEMSENMKNKEGGGGEFLVAIRAAESCEACTKLILGDRDSVTTIQRAAQLAMESGNPLRVLQKLSEANAQEMEQLEMRVRQDLGDNVDSGDFQVAMMERLKADEELRNRLFSKLEQEVPEFTEAFLHERDFIMARAIAREIESDFTLKQVVAVVGLAHVPGIQAKLQEMLQQQQFAIQE